MRNTEKRGLRRTMATVNPIREIKKIEAIKKILSSSKKGLTLFIFGINSSLRISDILKLNIGDVVDECGKIRRNVIIYEKKTGKQKQFPLNNSITAALKEYLKDRKCSQNCAIAPESPLFISSHKKRLSYSQAWRIIKGAGEAVGLEHLGTHSLRKTFGYHVYKRTGGNLGLVQKLLNHGSSGDTIKYIGIDQEQMDNVYLKLNL